MPFPSHPVTGHLQSTETPPEREEEEREGKVLQAEKKPGGTATLHTSPQYAPPTSPTQRCPSLGGPGCLIHLCACPIGS